MSKSIDVSGTISAISGMSDEARSRLRANAESWLTSGEHAKEAAARSVLSELNRTETAAHVESLEILADDWVDRVRHAFTRRPPTETEARVISVLLKHPDETSTNLSRRLGWDGQTWHVHFGTCCHAREDLLWRASLSPIRKEPFYSGILAEFSKPTGTWRVRPELEKVLAEIVGLRWPIGETEPG